MEEKRATEKTQREKELEEMKKAEKLKAADKQAKKDVTAKKAYVRAGALEKLVGPRRADGACRLPWSPPKRKMCVDPPDLVGTANIGFAANIAAEETAHRATRSSERPSIRLIELHAGHMGGFHYPSAAQELLTCTARSGGGAPEQFLRQIGFRLAGHWM